MILPLFQSILEKNKPKKARTKAGVRHGLH